MGQLSVVGKQHKPRDILVQPAYRKNVIPPVPAQKRNHRGSFVVRGSRHYAHGLVQHIVDKPAVLQNLPAEGYFVRELMDFRVRIFH